MAAVGVFRRSAAGSIAATAWARKQSITSGQVFPPVGGGLHCGEVHAGVRCLSLRQYSRRSPAGSNAATAGHGKQSITSGQVLQPVGGGLQCGEPRDVIHVQPGRACSRRSSAGSIAAAGPGSGISEVSTSCSCRLKAGPIGQRPGRGRAGPDRCSRRSRRAPLRRDGDVVPGELVVECSRRSRRAPLRLDPGDVRDPPHVRVFPPVNGGLHCGRRPDQRPVNDAARCSRRSMAGSIAAPTMTDPQTDLRVLRRPPAGSIAARRL